MIAQALVSASQTVTAPLGLHSYHCYFLLPALADPAIEYHVEKIRDGKSYANRLVKAIQNGKVIFILAASYTVPPIHLPKLETGSTPMSFQPYMAEGKAVEDKEARVSHSLRFAIDSSDSQAVKDNDVPNTRDVHPVPTGVTNGWKNGDAGEVRRYKERYQMPFPEDVLQPEECPEEEERWAKFISEATDETNRRKKRIVEEYIQVSPP